MESGSWTAEVLAETLVQRPSPPPLGTIIAFSGRGHAPDGEEAPTAFLARRFAKALGLEATPIFWGKQVHGAAAATIRAKAFAPEIGNVGECDALVTDRAGVALVVQTADCVPILLSAKGAVGAAHAGWKGSADNVAAAAVEALRELGAEPQTLRAWLGPSIGPCCYEVGGEVAARFAGDFVRAGYGGDLRLDLRAVNRSQLEVAGLAPENIAIHPACTKCGGESLASYRRDGERAGRMIALIARLAP